MADPGERDPRAPAGRLRGWIALPAAAALIALVAFASRSTSVPLGSIAIDFSPSWTAIEVIGYVGIFVGTCALLLGAALWRGRMRHLRPDRLFGTRRQPTAVPWWANVLALVVLVGMLVVEVIVIVAYIAELRRLAEQAGNGGGSGGVPGLIPASGAPDYDPAALSVALVIVLGLGVALVALAIRTRLHDDREPDAGAGDLHATVAAVELSLGALRSEPDPRRAVIAAYGAMERSLSGAGYGRRRSEAPLEYLRRVLAAPALGAQEVRTITLLFQHAKFSQHEVDETMRTGAVDALERIRLAANASRAPSVPRAAAGSVAPGGPA